MNLNNHGWGLNEMLIYCGVLLFFLMIAIFFIIQLSNSLGDTFKSSITGGITYSMVEDNVENATASYIEKYYNKEIGTGTITVMVDNLLKYNMLSESSLKPMDEDDACGGYALVKKENEEIVIRSYIKCSKYKSEDYESWRIGE